eukprot:31497-Pelagococcus_subviridis.AAC.73
MTKSALRRTFFAIRRGARRHDRAHHGKRTSRDHRRGVERGERAPRAAPREPLAGVGEVQGRAGEIPRRSLLFFFKKYPTNAEKAFIRSLVSDAPRRLHPARKPHLTRRACSTGTTR